MENIWKQLVESLLNHFNILVNLYVKYLDVSMVPANLTSSNEMMQNKTNKPHVISKHCI